jgi:MYXO-CTERM domain-containing protein
VKRGLLALALAAALTASGSAQANGRYPESNQIQFNEADPDLVVLRVTFGLLISRDRGVTWRWVCERAIGYLGTEDPMYALTPSGRILGSTFNGVTMTKDNACSWSFAFGGPSQRVFVDLAQSPKDRKNILALAAAYDKQDDAGGVLYKTEIFETKDEGDAFTAIASAFDPTMLGETLDLTASDPNRIYMSAVQVKGTAPTGLFLASRDRGVSWETTEVPLLQPCDAAMPCAERSLYIAGVDPNNADRVYLRTRNAVDRPARLIMTDDGGKTFKTIFSSKGSLPAFALSPDGSRVWVGGQFDGIFSASTADLLFQQRSSTPVQCLTVGAEGLWACSNENNKGTGFIVGLSRDEGSTFEAKLHFCDVLGAVECPAGTITHTECAAGWPAQEAQIGCGQPVGDGGTDGGGTSSGQPVGDGGGGCSCRTTEGSPYATAALALALGTAVALLRRRRRS